MSDFADLNQWYETTGRAHLTFLRWLSTVGHARHNGVGVDLSAPPACLNGAHDIEYLPAGPARVDDRGMTEDELTSLRRVLVQMAEGARDALDGHSTLAVVFDNAGKRTA